MYNMFRGYQLTYVVCTVQRTPTGKKYNASKQRDTVREYQRVNTAVNRGKYGKTEAGYEGSSILNLPVNDKNKIGTVSL